MGSGVYVDLAVFFVVGGDVACWVVVMMKEEIGRLGRIASLVRLVAAFSIRRGGIISQYTQRQYRIATTIGSEPASGYSVAE